MASQAALTPSRPPLQGYNHNVRYGTRVYHVQTEDSGVEHPHLFTHLFHEGVIIASAKTDYSELAKQPAHEKAVRKLMQEQHKQLMKELRRGRFDDKIIAIFGKDPENDTVAGEDDASPPAEAESARTDTHSRVKPRRTPARDTAPGGPPAEVVEQKIPPAVPQLGAAEVGAAEVGAAEVGAAEVGAAEVGAAEVDDSGDNWLEPDLHARLVENEAKTLRMVLDWEELQALVPAEPPGRVRSRTPARLTSPPPQPPAPTEPDLNGSPLPTADDLIDDDDLEEDLERTVVDRSPADTVAQLTDARSASAGARPRPPAVPAVPTPSSEPARTTERRRTGVFDAPLPRSAEPQASAERRDEQDSAAASGARPPHPDPRVRQRDSRPALRTVGSGLVGSTPQRYTAPSPRANLSAPRPKRITGSYASARPAASAAPPAAPLADANTEESGVYQISLGGAKPMRPRKPAERQATRPAVIARPAVIVDRAPRRTPRPVRHDELSGLTSGNAQPPPAPRRPTRSGNPRVARRSSPHTGRVGSGSTVFGADLISERSLDEVILQYLSEDKE